MPALLMQSERGGKHKLPHIHAIYGESEVVIGLDSTVLEAGEGFFRIDPLK